MRTHPREQLSALLDGELPPDEAARVQQHLAVCTECTRELAIMREIGGAMRTLKVHEGGPGVWPAVHARITRPVGWILIIAGLVIWLALALAAWWRAALTAEWLAGTAVTVGLLLLAIGIGYEQLRDWQRTRYKDVQQ